MTKKFIARENFNAGMNCSQAVIVALAEDVGLSEDTAKAIACPFGGGFSRKREVCGAVSGMLMAIGLAHPEMNKMEMYAYARKAMDEFSEKTGSIICRELLGLDEGADSPIPSKRTEEYYKERPCEYFVKYASEIIEKEILN